MAIPNQVPESSMEEILASIRKIISDDESKTVVAKPHRNPLPEIERPANIERLANNVSRLFDEEPASLHSESDGDSLELAIEPDDTHSMDTADRTSDPVRFAEFEDEPVATARTFSRAAGKQAVELPDAGASLLSPRADAAVTSAFNQLANTILSNNSRTVEQLAEEMMRPMLKAWLDDNLPPLVERLVREEIERVSRRR